jgi:hypothetical protein
MGTTNTYASPSACGSNGIRRMGMNENYLDLVKILKVEMAKNVKE